MELTCWKNENLGPPRIKTRRQRHEGPSGPACLEARHRDHTRQRGRVEGFHPVQPGSFLSRRPTEWLSLCLGEEDPSQPRLKVRSARSKGSCYDIRDEIAPYLPGPETNGDFRLAPFVNRENHGRRRHPLPPPSPPSPNQVNHHQGGKPDSDAEKIAIEVPLNHLPALAEKIAKAEKGGDPKE